MLDWISMRAKWPNFFSVWGPLQIFPCNINTTYPPLYTNKNNIIWLLNDEKKMVPCSAYKGWITRREECVPYIIYTAHSKTDAPFRLDKARRTNFPLARDTETDNCREETRRVPRTKILPRNTNQTARQLFHAIPLHAPRDAPSFRWQLLLIKI